MVNPRRQAPTFIYKNGVKSTGEIMLRGCRASYVNGVPVVASVATLWVGNSRTLPGRLLPEPRAACACSVDHTYVDKSSGSPLQCRTTRDIIVDA